MGLSSLCAGRVWYGLECLPFRREAKREDAAGKNSPRLICLVLEVT
jgi:hypothetical protein